MEGDGEVVTKLRFHFPFDFCLQDQLIEYWLLALTAHFLPINASQLKISV